MPLQLNWGLVGGGETRQIGSAHRIGARLDGHFELVAGALDINPVRAREFAVRLGVPEDRAYGDWREMLGREKRLPTYGRLDLVTVATPNSTHHEISKAFLEAGFHVLCEKPLTVTLAEGENLVRTARDADRILAVNYGYSGYPMVRQARSMVRDGKLGRIRIVVAEFSHGSHADAADADNPGVRWRYDPEQTGVSSVLADAGLHALHMACFVIGQQVTRVSADFVSVFESRELEDDALLALRFAGGATGRLWTSAVAVGQQHGLNLRVFGELGGLHWVQEHPNQLYWPPLGKPTRTRERGDVRLSGEARLASRITVGHAEGFPGAIANIYSNLAETIRARDEGRAPHPAATWYPAGEEGLRTLAVVHAAARSARNGGTWVEPQLTSTGDSK